MWSGGSPDSSGGDWIYSSLLGLASSFLLHPKPLAYLQKIKEKGYSRFWEVLATALAHDSWGQENITYLSSEKHLRQWEVQVPPFGWMALFFGDGDQVCRRFVGYLLLGTKGWQWSYFWWSDVHSPWDGGKWRPLCHLLLFALQVFWWLSFWIGTMTPGECWLMGALKTSFQLSPKSLVWSLQESSSRLSYLGNSLISKVSEKKVVFYGHSSHIFKCDSLHLLSWIWTKCRPFLSPSFPRCFLRTAHRWFFRSLGEEAIRAGGAWRFSNESGLGSAIRQSEMHEDGCW